MYRKWSLFSFFLVFVTFSCSVDPFDEEAIEEEIQEFLSSNNINAQQTPLGAYYVIDEVGTGELPTSSDLFVGHIRGSLTDRRVWLDTFDSDTFRSSLQVGGLMDGLRDALLLFPEGSKGRIIVPPQLGFGNSETNGVPPNSVLVFDVDVLGIYDSEAEYSKEQLTQYIQANSIEVDSSSSGLFWSFESLGDESIKPTENDRVRVNYRGYFLNGETFDSNEIIGAPVEFVLSQVIDGWTEGLQQFGEGAVGQLLIPSQLAYSARGSQTIAPHTPLIFDIELVEVVR